MKKTTILVKAFDCEFDLTIKRKEFLSIEDAETYIHKELTPTAFIKSVIHYYPHSQKTLNNKNYKL
jgi:hypothetical protein